MPLLGLVVDQWNVTSCPRSGESKSLAELPPATEKPPEPQTPASRPDRNGIFGIVIGARRRIEAQTKGLRTENCQLQRTGAETKHEIAACRVRRNPINVSYRAPGGNTRSKPVCQNKWEIHKILLPYRITLWVLGFCFQLQ